MCLSVHACVCVERHGLHMRGKAWFGMERCRQVCLGVHSCGKGWIDGTMDLVGSVEVWVGGATGFPKFHTRKWA